ncbi:MAG TPA: chemotaxis protein CheB [Anaerolineae bacterium]|nr:chemotaxis protein CheB [Anaerolineae bacterium]
MRRYQLVVMGVSAGGTTALKILLPSFPADYPLPIIVVQHLHPTQTNFLVTHFNAQCALTVKEADEKEPLLPGILYFAPPNYHLLIEPDRTLSLSIDEKVNYSRPSIDVLFESAAIVYKTGVIGVVMTGANNDGAAGLRAIKEYGGLAVVQDPATAEVPYMPQAAMAATSVDHVLPLADIGALLREKAQLLL